MERRIDLSRDRQMLCGICFHRWAVDLDWIDGEPMHARDVDVLPGPGISA